MGISFKYTFMRMLRAAGLKNGAELSRSLGIAPQAISNYKRRDELPSRLVARFADRFGVSMDWLMTGKGPVYRGGKASTQEEHALRAESSRVIKPTEEEFLYVERLVRILRSPEEHASYSIKASLDALLSEITEDEDDTTALAEPLPDQRKKSPKRDSASS